MTIEKLVNVYAGCYLARIYNRLFKKKPAGPRNDPAGVTGYKTEQEVWDNSPPEYRIPQISTPPRFAPTFIPSVAIPSVVVKAKPTKKKAKAKKR